METNNKLREALKRLITEMTANYADEEEFALWCDISIETIRKAKAALAEPVKNYEVGTPEEQYERYKRRCKAQDCRDCPVRGNFKRIGSESCQLVWAQMPYEKGGAK